MPDTESRTCSQLSRTSCVEPRRRNAATKPSMSRDVSSMPMDLLIARTASLGTAEMRSHHQTVPDPDSVRRYATSVASDVLPIPPGPVSVTSRSRVHSSRMLSVSISRPMSDSRPGSKFVRLELSLRGAGNTPGPS